MKERVTNAHEEDENERMYVDENKMIQQQD
jgi:hypothetical protein